MTQINVDQAKMELSSLLERARGGEEIVIADNGEPLVRLVAVNPLRRPRKPGTAKGKIKIHESFFDPLPKEIQRAFDGETEE